MARLSWQWSITEKKLRQLTWVGLEVRLHKIVHEMILINSLDLLTTLQRSVIPIKNKARNQ